MLHSSDLRESLCWAITDIHAKGWASGTGGNFSVVLSQQPLALLMAPSGVDKGLLQPEDLIEVNAHGEVLAGQGRASAETLLHLAIVQHTQAGAVLHTHSVFNTLLSDYYQPQGHLLLSGYEMLKGLEGIRTHTAIVQLPIVANSQDMTVLSEALRSHLPNPAHGVLIAGHGLYVWGKTLFQARRHLEILEFLLELTYRKLAMAAD